MSKGDKQMTKQELDQLSALLDEASDTFTNIAVRECHSLEEQDTYWNKALKCAEVRMSLKFIRPRD